MFVHRKCFRGRAAVPQSVPNVLNDGGDEFGICRLTLCGIRCVAEKLKLHVEIPALPCTLDGIANCSFNRGRSGVIIHCNVFIHAFEVRLNSEYAHTDKQPQKFRAAMLVLQPERQQYGIGHHCISTLLFVPLCGESFHWNTYFQMP